jgi:hypothetical protein
MRRLFSTDPSSWNSSDVEELIRMRMPEGQRIEYKRELRIDTKSQKAEAAKDVSGFANAQGGLLVFGVAEDDSKEPVPTEMSPLPAAGLQTRLENLLDSTLEPVPDYRVSTITVEDGVVIVVRVQAHAGPPVMVQGYGEYRYFRRSGTRTRPMTGAEVAAAHAAAERRLERVDNRLRGLPLLARMFRPRSVDALRAGQELEYKPLATVVVASIDGPDELIGPQWMNGRAFEEVTDGYRGGNGSTIRRDHHFTINAHGLIEEHIDRDIAADAARVLHRVAIYRAGAVEWAHRYREYQIPSRSFADAAHNALLYAASVFDRVGYSGRVAAWVRIENAENAQLMIARDWDIDTRLPQVEWIGTRCEVVVDDLLADPTPTVRDAMDRIWQAFGINRCLLFDEQGNWRAG